MKGQAMDNNTTAWRVFAEGLVKLSERRTIRLVMEVIAETLIKERNTMRAELTAELKRQMAALRYEFLQDRLDAERGVSG
jgi:hypothetical protein